MRKTKNRPDDYLNMTYSRVLIPDIDSGTYSAEILEFPGCIAQGDTPQEAYDNLEDTAKAWLEAALDLNQEIPPPSQTISYGGRILLRLPKSLHRNASIFAQKEGVSLNQFVVSTIAEKVGAHSLIDRLAERIDQRIHYIASNVANTLVTSFSLTMFPYITGTIPPLSNLVKTSQEVGTHAGDQEYSFLPQGSCGSTN